MVSPVGSSSGTEYVDQSTQADASDATASGRATAATDTATAASVPGDPFGLTKALDTRCVWLQNGHGPKNDDNVTLAKLDMKTALGLIDFNKPGASQKATALLGYIEHIYYSMDDNVTDMLQKMLGDLVNVCGKDTITDTDGKQVQVNSTGLSDAALTKNADVNGKIWDTLYKSVFDAGHGNSDVQKAESMWSLTRSLPNIDWSQDGAEAASKELMLLLNGNVNLDGLKSKLSELEGRFKFPPPPPFAVAQDTSVAASSAGADGSGGATAAQPIQISTQVQADVVALSQIITANPQGLTADDVSTLSGLSKSLANPDAAPLQVTAKTAPAIKAGAELLLKDIQAAGQAHKLTGQDLKFVQSFGGGLDELIAAFSSGSYQQTSDTQTPQTKPVAKARTTPSNT